MAGAGIWLDDATYLAQQGQMWAQQRVQDLHNQISAGNEWANQQIAGAQEAARQQFAQLQVATTPPPLPSSPPPTPVAAPRPTPTPVPQNQVARGQSWADQMISNLTQPAAQPTPAPAPTPALASTPLPSDVLSGVQQALSQVPSQAQDLVSRVLGPQAAGALPQPPSPTPTPTPSPTPTPPPSATPQPVAEPIPPTARVGVGKTDFVSGLAGAAEQVAAESGLPAQVLLAIPANETGWGKSVAANNLYGIKGSNPQTGANTGPIATQEVYGGQRVNISDTFRAYSDPVESMRDFAAFLRDNPRYAPALGQYAQDGDADHLVQNIARAGYATDPNWATQVNSIAHDIQGTLGDLRAKGQLQTPVAQAQQPGQGEAVNTPNQAQQAAVARSQFALGLSSGDAIAFCGPAAALAFAQTYGRNPTVAEAKQLAQQVGWNPQQGMAGPQSEVALLHGLGVDAHYSQGIDWGQIGRDAQGGNPVIVDTPGHYYYVDGYNTQTGQLHVGTSGTDLKGGSEWMTPAQINAMPQSQGAARGAIFADHPLAHQDGLAQSIGQAASAAGQALEGAPSAVGQLLQQGTSAIAQGAQALQSAAGNFLQPVSQGIMTQAQNVLNAVTTVGQQATTALGGGLEAVQPALQQLGQPLTQPVLDLGQQLASNALTAAGIPNVAGQALSTAASLLPGQSAVQEVQNLITSGQRPDLAQTALGQAVMNAPGALGGVLGPTTQNALNATLALPQTVSSAAGGLLQPVQSAAQQALAGSVLSNALGLPSPPGAMNLNAPLFGPGQSALQALGTSPLGQAIAGAPVLGGGLGALGAFVTNPVEYGPVPAATAAQQRLGDLIANSDINALRREYFPNITEPNHPINVMRDLQNKYGTFLPNERMTPEDLERARNAIVAVAGVAQPTSPAGGAEALAGGGASWLSRLGGNIGDLIQATRIGSLAGGIPTVAHIALNFPVQAGLKLLSDVPMSVLSGHPEAVPMELYGAMQGLRSWALTAAQTLGQAGPLAEKLGGGVGPQVLETGLTGLVRTHPVLQELAGQVAQHMELWRQAATEATRTGFTRFSPDWQAEVSRLIANPTQAMADASEYAGRRASLNLPLGTTGKALEDAIKQAPLLRFVLPIFNKGYQIATQGIETSPLGFAGTAWDVARAVTGRGGPYGGEAGFTGRGAADAVTPLAQRLRNNLIGTGLAFEAYNLAAQGNITGEGPADPQARQTLMDMGWQPDSIRIGGRYIDSHLLGPVGWALTMGANAYEATHGPEAAGYMRPVSTPQGQRPPNAVEVFGDLVAREGRYFNNETFLRSLGSVLNLIGSSAQLGTVAPREAASIIESLIPQGALLGNIASAQDPYARQVLPQPGNPMAAVWQSVETRLPGLRENVPTRLTATGQPLPNPQQGAGLLVPRSSVINADPVLAAMAAAGVTAKGAPEKVPYGPSGEIRLSPEEQHRFEEYRGQILRQAAGSMIQSPQWRTMPIEAQRAALQQVNATASDAAGKLVLRDIGAGGLGRMIPTGVLAPVESYLPVGLNDQYLNQAAILRNQMQHQALMQSLLGGESGLQALIAANAAAARV
jgi:flagellum-specific peptidoglycan hydrolase FlgJ